MDGRWTGTETETGSAWVAAGHRFLTQPLSLSQSSVSLWATAHQEYHFVLRASVLMAHFGPNKLAAFSQLPTLKAPGYPQRLPKDI